MEDFRLYSEKVLNFRIAEIFSPLHITSAVKSTELFSICAEGKVPQDYGISQNG